MGISIGSESGSALICGSVSQSQISQTYINTYPCLHLGNLLLEGEALPDKNEIGGAEAEGRAEVVAPVPDVGDEREGVGGLGLDVVLQDVTLSKILSILGGTKLSTYFYYSCSKENMHLILTHSVQ